MQPYDVPEGMKLKRFNGIIWSLFTNEKDGLLILDCRDEKNKVVEIFTLHLTTLRVARLPLELSWWENIIGIHNGNVYAVQYKDKNNPMDHLFKCINSENGEVNIIDELPIFPYRGKEPSLYENGTKYHQMVSRFLMLDLPLSCEYFEMGDKIIISYYLRSKRGFDRYLLFISCGRKKWKILQDQSMKGFSPGAFFVLNDELIFVRNQNEVCIYTI